MDLHRSYAAAAVLLSFSVCSDSRTQRFHDLLHVTDTNDSVTILFHFTAGFDEGPQDVQFTSSEL